MTSFSFTGISSPSNSWNKFAGRAFRQKWFNKSAHENIPRVTKDNLTRAHERMKHYVDKHRSERVSNVGDVVYLKIQQQYKHTSLSIHRLETRLHLWWPLIYARKTNWAPFGSPYFSLKRCNIYGPGQATLNFGHGRENLTLDGNQNAIQAGPWWFCGTI
jgi:hypothetical protein